MINKFNEYTQLFESTLKDAKIYLDKNYNDIEWKENVFDAIKRMLSKKVKSSYCNKNDNYNLALLLTKIASDTESSVKIFSNKIINQKDDYIYNDNIIDSVINSNGDSVEKLLCYILKYDKYLNYLPIKPITAYTDKNVKRYQQSIGGNTNISVYEALTDHIIRYLPVKLQSNEWVNKFPSNLKSDYKSNINEYENIFLSALDTYNTLNDNIKKSINNIYFGDNENKGVISRFKKFNDFLNDFRLKLKGDIKDKEKLLDKIENYGNDIKLVYNKNNIVIVVIYTYKASVDFGADTRWCISDKNSKNHYNSYCGISSNNKQYFIWDFNLEPSDNNFRIGVTIDNYGEIYAAHNKLDQYMPDVLKYLKDIGVPVGRIFKSLTKIEQNNINRIIKIKDKFLELLSSYNNGSKNKSKIYKKIKDFYLKYNDIISSYLNNDEIEIFYNYVVLNGDIELFDKLIETNEINLNKQLNYSFILLTAYKNNKDLFNHIINNYYEYFKFEEFDYRLKDNTSKLFSLVDNYELFNKLYKMFIQNIDDKEILNDYIFNNRGFLDNIIKDDNLELLKQIEDKYSYIVPENYHSEVYSGSNNILKLIYYIRQENSSNVLSDIVKYLINNGYEDNTGYYTIYCYINNHNDILNTIISNGYDDIDILFHNIVFDYIDLLNDNPIKKLNILDYINFDYSINDNNKRLYNLLFSKQNLDASRRLISKNIKLLFDSYNFYSNSHTNDNINLGHYLNIEDDINYIRNTFNKLPSIFNELYNDHIRKDQLKEKFYNLYYKSSIKYKLHDIFEKCINYIDIRLINQLNFEGHGEEFIKTILDNSSENLTMENLIKIYYNYNYKDLTLKIIKNVLNEKDNITSLFHRDDKKREIINILVNSGDLNKENLSKIDDLHIGIYINSYDNLKLIYQDIGIKAKEYEIYNYINYAINDINNKNNDNIDIYHKNNIEILYDAGSDINKSRWSYIDKDDKNINKLIEYGLYYSTKFLIDKGANIENISNTSIITSCNTKLLNYFINEFKIDLNNQRISKYYNISFNNKLYSLSKEYIDLIFKYINNKLFITEDLIELLIEYNDVDLFKYTYNKIEDMNILLFPSEILVNIVNSKYNTQNIKIIKFLVDKGADYENLYHEYKRSKTFKKETREYFKDLIKQTKLKESNIINYDDFIKLY